MFRCTKLFEADDKLAWLRTVLSQQGLEPDRGALVSLSQTPDQAGYLYSGVWIGQDQKLWEFSATVGRDSRLTELESFNDVTNEVTVTAHGRGTGRSFGQLAIEVLRELHVATLANVKPRRQIGEA